MKLQIDRRGEDVRRVRADERATASACTRSRRELQPQIFAGAVVGAVRRVPAVGARGVGAVDAGVEGLSPRRAAPRPQRANRELARARREADARASAATATRCARIDGWVRRHIKSGGGALDEAATSILAREEGNRITLEAALLRAAGVPSRHLAGASAARRAARRRAARSRRLRRAAPASPAGCGSIRAIATPPPASSRRRLRGGARLRAGAGRRCSTARVPTASPDDRQHGLRHAPRRRRLAPR